LHLFSSQFLSSSDQVLISTGTHSLSPPLISRLSNIDASLVRLSLLFALGSVVIITTIVRVPLILRDDAQKTRSLVRTHNYSLHSLIILTHSFPVGICRNLCRLLHRASTILPSRLGRSSSRSTLQHRHALLPRRWHPTTITLTHHRQSISNTQ